MKDVFSALSDLQARARELKSLIVVSAPESDAAALRKALYELESAIHSMERAAADAFSAPQTRAAKSGGMQA